jgi:hypothetical protein
VIPPRFDPRWLDTDLDKPFRASIRYDYGPIVVPWKSTYYMPITDCGSGASQPPTPITPRVRVRLAWRRIAFGFADAWRMLAHGR